MTTTSDLAPPDATRRKGKMQFASVLIILCGMILFFDIGGELHAALLFPESLSPVVLVHLGAELAASVALAAAFVMIRHEIRVLDRERRSSDLKLGALREDFDSLVRQRFSHWQLTPTEADVALLTLRGLKISEIAEARQTQIGTVKSQLSSIFRKSAVSTRTEFVAGFIDEFLEFSSSPRGTTPKS